MRIVAVDACEAPCRGMHDHDSCFTATDRLRTHSKATIEVYSVCMSGYHAGSSQETIVLIRWSLQIGVQCHVYPAPSFTLHCATEAKWGRLLQAAIPCNNY